MREATLREAGPLPGAGPCIFGERRRPAVGIGVDHMDLLTGHCRLRVRYDECDSMGITYHARYLDWFVIGRTELLRGAGLPYAGLERAGLLLPVLEARCRYLASTRYDDTVCIETTLLNVTRTWMSFAYRVFWSGRRMKPESVGLRATSELVGLQTNPGSMRRRAKSESMGLQTNAESMRRRTRSERPGRGATAHVRPSPGGSRGSWPKAKRCTPSLTNAIGRWT